MKEAWKEELKVRDQIGSPFPNPHGLGADWTQSRKSLWTGTRNTQLERTPLWEGWPTALEQVPLGRKEARVPLLPEASVCWFGKSEVPDANSLRFHSNAVERLGVPGCDLGPGLAPACGAVGSREEGVDAEARRTVRISAAFGACRRWELLLVSPLLGPLLPGLSSVCLGLEKGRGGS